MNDCLLESENFQITKADNNKYLLLPVKKQPAEKIVLKECGKDFDKMNNSHSHFTTTPKNKSIHTLNKKNYLIDFTHDNHQAICVIIKLFCFIQIIIYDLDHE